MLELRPTCEHCNIPLPSDSLEARIGSYECTFCAECVAHVLGNVYPICGGGFVPFRPSRIWRGGNFLGKDPASTRIRRRPVDPIAHATFAGPIVKIPPEERQLDECDSGELVELKRNGRSAPPTPTLVGRYPLRYGIVGRSRGIADVIRLIELVSGTRSTVLITQAFPARCFARSSVYERIA